MTGSSPYPPGFGAPPPGGGPPQPPNGPGYVLQPPATFGPSTPPKQARTGLLASGVVVAVLLGVASLLLSIIGITRGSEPPPPPPVTPQAEKQELFVDDADKALCEVIAPLMKESDEKNRVLTNAGPPGSPERSAVIPEIKKHTLDWASRMQKLIDDHADPPGT